MDAEQRTEVRDDAFISRLTTAKRLAMIAGIIGAAIGVLLSVAYLAQRENPNLKGAFGLPVVGGVGAWGIVMALVLLFASDAFFTSPQGQEYLQQIGTKSVLGARIVLVIFVLIGCAFVGIFGFIGVELFYGRM
jgi:hypothetical protein